MNDVFLFKIRLECQNIWGGKQTQTIFSQALIRLLIITSFWWCACSCHPSRLPRRNYATLRLSRLPLSQASCKRGAHKSNRWWSLWREARKVGWYESCGTPSHLECSRANRPKSSPGNCSDSHAPMSFSPWLWSPRDHRSPQRQACNYFPQRSTPDRSCRSSHRRGPDWLGCAPRKPWASAARYSRHWCIDTRWQKRRIGGRKRWRRWCALANHGAHRRSQPSPGLTCRSRAANGFWR